MLRSSLNTKPLGVVLLTCSRHVFFFFLRKVCKNSSPKLLVSCKIISYVADRQKIEESMLETIFI